MLLDELAHLIDGSNAVEITLALCHSPGEQTVAAKDQSLRPRIILHSLFDQQRQFKSGTLPGNPHDSPPEFGIELLEFAPAVSTAGQGDGPVWMQVIHMRKR